MVLVALILASAAPADALPKARQTYASCLSDYTNGAMGKPMSKEEFAAGLTAKCAAKEKTFREALIAADKADGMSDADAQEDADDQVEGYIEQMTDNFESGE